MQTPALSLGGLIDLGRLQRICDSFAASGEVALAVIDPGGIVLVSSGWQDICKDFHRVHGATLTGCLESDTRINLRLNDILDGPGAPRHYAYRCANGLWDVAIPLIVAGEHLANVFAGQFFYDDDQIDVAAFRARASRLSFDETAYVEALARVPVLSHERVAQTIAFLADFVGMLADLGLSVLREGRERDALRESEETFRYMTENSSDVIWHLDRDYRFDYISPADERIRGYTQNEVIGTTFWSLLKPEGIEHVKLLNAQRVAEERAGIRTGTIRYELEQKRRDGSWVWMETNATAHHDRDGKLIGLHGVSRDMSARKQTEQQIHEQHQDLLRLNDELAARAAALEEANATISRIAATDDLTGLANRRHFYETLERAVSLARRHGSPLAFVSLDLDGLKEVNDSAGHQAGDAVLTSFAALFGTLCRTEDLAARLGGDEFGLLLPGIDLAGARGLAERVLAAVRSCAALAQNGVTASAGVVQWAPEERPDDLLRRADEALYAAKRGGGDAVADDG
jgi:diguanylate cyclase (GGDEF)-like protein/PAS domain S-box-containing protein